MAQHHQHIVINALVTPPQPVGVGNYIKELIRSLMVHRKDWLITIIGYKGYKKTLFDDMPAGNMQCIELPFLYNPRWFSLPLTLIWQRFRLNNLLKNIDATVYMHPNTAYMPYTSIPTVVTIHDLLELDTDAYSIGSNIYRTWVLKKLVERSDYILTVSQFSATRISHYFPLVNDKIQVIPPFIKVQPQINVERVKEKLLFCVTNSKAYKNLATLVWAFSASNLPKTGWQLVLSGNISNQTLKDFDLADIEPVILTGYISEAELLDYYTRSSYYISPSLYEGYDLPVREAFNTGCKLLLSDIPVHREYYEGKAIFFNPTDIQNLIGVLNELEDSNTKGIAVC